MKSTVRHCLGALDQLPQELRRNKSLCIDLAAFFLTHANYLRGLEVRERNKIFFIMNNLVMIEYGQGKKNSFDEKLNHPNLKDMLSQLYPTGNIKEGVHIDYDPGRFRVKPFFDSIYGATIKQVKENLIPIRFLGRNVLFNVQNNASIALEAVGLKLSELIENNPDLISHILPLGGTFNWRTIAGTNRPSPHSWGIAIDLHARPGTDWHHSMSRADVNILKIRNDFPIEVVKIFEEYGFIWGGKWFHFDTIHFEYRPELLQKANLIHNRHMYQFLEN